MTKNKRKNVFLFILFATILTTYMLYEQVANNYIFVFQLYFQKFIDLFYPYLNTIDESISTDDLLIVSDSMPRNHLCPAPRIKHNSKQAIEHLNNDLKALRATFEICEKTANEIEPIRIVDVNDESIDANYSIVLNVTYFHNRFGLTDENFECFVEQYDKAMNRTELNWDIETHAKFMFNKQTGYTVHLKAHGYFYVHCKRKSMTKRILFENVYYILPRNMSILMDERLKYRKFEETIRIADEDDMPAYLPLATGEMMPSYDVHHMANSKKANVLCFGFDSVSFNHFQRIFPLTYGYLANKLANNILYDQINSVGSNTYPNVVPLMSGIVVDDVGDGVASELGKYQSIDGSFHESFPFLWSDYEKLGYLTAYQEDSPSWSVFNYLKNGFRFRPTAFYGRPFWTKYYQIRTGPNMCHLNKPMYKTYFGLIRAFLERMHSLADNSKTPYFSFNFLSDYTHDFLAIPQKMDRFFMDMLSNMESNGYLDNTLLIIFSDHGNRLKPFAYGTGVGQSEKYAPFLSMRLPKALWNTTVHKNAVANKNRLISFYDVYQTLRHFSHMQTIDTTSRHSYTLNTSQYRLNRKDLRHLRGISLFESIPLNRSCSQSLIPDQQCRCFKHRPIDEQLFHKKTGLDFKQTRQFILKIVNNITENLRDHCALYTFERIHSLRLLNTNGNMEVYRFVVILKPGNAWFELNFEYLKSSNSFPLRLHGQIGRLSAYGNQSLCVDSTFLRSFCFCKKNLFP